MYTTIAPRKFKKKGYNRNNELSLECCWKESMQLKVATSTQQLKNMSKKWLNLALG